MKDKWQEREYRRDIERFNYWNYLRNKPISYFLYPLPINIVWLFENHKLRKRIGITLFIIASILTLIFYLPWKGIISEVIFN